MFATIYHVHLSRRNTYHAIKKETLSTAIFTHTVQGKNLQAISATQLLKIDTYLHCEKSLAFRYVKILTSPIFELYGQYVHQIKAEIIVNSNLT